jgi:hypothetical protein
VLFFLKILGTELCFGTVGKLASFIYIGRIQKNSVILEGIGIASIITTVINAITIGFHGALETLCS